MSSVLTDCGNVHVLASRRRNEEVNTNTTLYHLARELPESGMLCLKELFLALDTMQIILISQEQSPRT